jgi:signal transduction histidine kinase
VRYNRLLVRHKLNLLVSIPLLMVALLMVPLLSARVTVARLAQTTAGLAETARRTSSLIEEIQGARLLSVSYLDGYLVDAGALNLELARVSDGRAQLLSSLGDGDQALGQAIRGASVIAETGPRVLAHRLTDQEILGIYRSVIGSLIQSLGLDRQSTAAPQDAWRLSGLLALLQANEAASEAGALLMVAATNTAVRNQAVSDGSVVQGLEQERVAVFSRLAAPAEVALFQQATGGAAAQRLADAAAQVGLSGANAIQSGLAGSVFSAVESQTTVRELVEATIAQDVAQASLAAGTGALVQAGLLIGLGLFLLGVVVLLSVLVGRSVSVPLQRLTRAAGSVADVAAEELANVADDDAGPGAVRRLPELPVDSGDELGQLAVAFNRVQGATAGLLERQVVGRRNVAAMFASIGRRTSSLVGRQLALIDVLEGAEEDAQTLRTLYRLDHLSTRLRRNASSLVVLSGDREVAADEGAVVSLPDAVRASLGSVEDFQRVVLSALPQVHLSPGASVDVVLILAELIENGVLFSPPQTSVEVTAWVTPDGRYALTVVDHGIGIPPERLAEENARLRQRERLDLAPTDVLGLFVVGRVSRRHGIEVTLIPTPGGGLTAHVLLPAILFVDHPWVSGQSGAEPEAAGSGSADRYQWSPEQGIPVGVGSAWGPVSPQSHWNTPGAAQPVRTGSGSGSGGSPDRVGAGWNGSDRGAAGAEWSGSDRGGVGADWSGSDRGGVGADWSGADRSGVGSDWSGADRSGAGVDWSGWDRDDHEELAGTGPATGYPSAFGGQPAIGSGSGPAPLLAGSSAAEPVVVEAVVVEPGVTGSFRAGPAVPMMEPVEPLDVLEPVIEPVRAWRPDPVSLRPADPVPHAPAPSARESAGAGAPAATPAGGDLPREVRRRVPGTHWEGPAPVPISAEHGRPAPVDRIPVTRDPGMLDRIPPGLMAGDTSGPPDPEATRRQVEELENALAGLWVSPSPTGRLAWDSPSPGDAAPSEAPGIGPDAEPVGGPVQNGSPAAAATTWPAPEPVVGRLPGGREPGVAGWDGGLGSGPAVQPGQPTPLMRRVPGATLASLGVVLPEGSIPASAPLPPVEIDPDETLQAILDVDEAVQRARAQALGPDGWWGTDDAVSRWGGREDGGAR